MPVGHRRYGKRRKIPFIAAEREGLAIARALAWRGRVKSRAMVRRRGKGLKYRVKRSDSGKVHVAKINDFDYWQFGSDAPSDDIGQAFKPQTELWRFYMPIDPTPKKIIQKNKKRKIERLEKFTDKIAQKTGIDSLFDKLKKSL